MSKLLTNWEWALKKRDDKIKLVIELITKARLAFTSNYELSMNVNRFATQMLKKADITCDDFLLYLLAQTTVDENNYWELRAFFERFFEITLPAILSQFNAFKISQKTYINMLQIAGNALLYLDQTPLTSAFPLDNLKLLPFNYTNQELKMIKTLIAFININHHNDKIVVMNFFSFYFFSAGIGKRALATRPSLLQQLSDQPSSVPLEINTINYEALLAELNGQTK